MMKPVALIAGLCTALAACSEAETKAEDDTCGAAVYQTRIGQPVEELGLTAGDKLRILGPGQPMTMDFRPDRLNIETDSTGQIMRVFCG
ncbi:I78 family peptidase inhibitor [Alloyangia pacifica]|uniref:I78 family peptidase inhibitor n=1 Tax=Alloyangia pacifica TaxID=311180 RepID=UPI001CD7430E|nr:I78 family peptidase inhibitor [Alloyangia pacifica]MCA0993948.1 hypothetical protein [Alloyangia pacifica]